MSAIFVGEESLVVSCAERWAEAGHEVTALVSDIDVIRDSAAERALTVWSFEEFTDADVEFDYLFSVVNSRILPDKVLELARKEAINFHDAPLPRYAGVNATNWAILNGETHHGISWHVMVEEVDAGAILEQRIFPIHPDDTALTLDARAYQEALSAFGDLVTGLADGSWTATEQDLSERSYFGQWLRPRAAGTIDPSRSVVEADRLLRALDHGPYSNPLAVAKLQLADRLLAIRSASVKHDDAGHAPGTVTDISGDAVTVACLDGSLEVDRVVDLDGAEMTAAAAFALAGHTVGDRLPEIDDAAAKMIAETASELARYERFWVRHLAEFDPVAAPYADADSDTDAATDIDAAGGPGRQLIEVQTPAAFRALTTDRNLARSGLVGSAATYLMLVQGRRALGVGFKAPDRPVPSEAEGYFAEVLPLNFEFEEDDDFVTATERMSQALAGLEKRRTHAKDLRLRSPRLADSPPLTCPVVIDLSGTDPSQAPPSSAVISIKIAADGGSSIWSFDGSAISPTDMTRITEQFAQLLEAIAAEPGAKLVELDYLPPNERQLLLETWNPPVDTSNHGDMVSRWRDRVRLSPQDDAVIWDGGRSSFEEIDGRSEQLAATLANRGAGPGSIVGIMAERSVEATIALIAVLKTGAAYLPLDPAYPADRLEHMVADSQTDIVLSLDQTLRGEAVAALKERVSGIEFVSIDAPQPDQPTWQPRIIEPDAPAYIIYTSGSTGAPKGVVVPHRAMVNHADGIIRAYGLKGSDRVLQFAALSFDVAAEEVFPTWLAGGAVVLRSEKLVSDLEELHRFLDHHRLTVVNLPAAYWSAWCDHLGRQESVSLPPTLRLVVTGSDGVPVDRFRLWSSLIGPSVGWLNGYGPTEATITASVFDPTIADPPKGPVVPIGRPIANVSLYVLDQRGHPAPIGVAGELHIGGNGVADGYLGQPDLTAERFVPDPFGSDPDGRLYKTGDLARYLHDGSVEFLGRIDDQVKVRGFRIELGEIEAALRDLEGIAQAAVVVGTDSVGNNQLLAHLVMENGRPRPDIGVLRESLEQRLPSYMIPVGFGFLSSFPMSPSGKVDRTALLEAPTIASAQTKVRPRTELEQQLADIWADVLGATDVGVHENFFELGGNSLSAIRLFSAIADQLHIRIQLPELFAAPSIAELAVTLSQDNQEDRDSPENQLPSWVFPVKATGDRPPLFHLGGASVVRVLAQYIDDDQPLYALVEQDFDADHFHTSIDDIVPHCIAGMKAVQPEGPYFIAGLCFGGIVALEMARSLQADGDEIGLVVMIDSFAPGAIKEANKVAADDPSPQRLVDTPRKPGRFRPSRLALKAWGVVWQAGWGPLHELLRRLERPMPSWFRDVIQANTIASDAYRANPYRGDVTLFMATDNIAKLDGGPKNGWGPLIDGTLTVAEVVGGHVSMYAEPNVVSLATELNTALDSAQRVDH